MAGRDALRISQFAPCSRRRSGSACRRQSSQPRDQRDCVTLSRRHGALRSSVTMRYVAGRYGQSVNASGKFESTLLGDLLIDTKELLRKVCFAIYKTPSEEAQKEPGSFKMRTPLPGYVFAHRPGSPSAVISSAPRSARAAPEPQAAFL
jgi:hypothetical protein